MSVGPAALTVLVALGDAVRVQSVVEVVDGAAQQVLGGVTHQLCDPETHTHTHTGEPVGVNPALNCCTSNSLTAIWSRNKKVNSRPKIRIVHILSPPTRRVFREHLISRRHSSPPQLPCVFLSSLRGKRLTNANTATRLTKRQRVMRTYRKQETGCSSSPEPF